MRERPMLYRPETSTPQFPGKCRKVVDGKVCGRPFRGPKNRKFCEIHSETIRYRGNG